MAATSEDPGNPGDGAATADHAEYDAESKVIDLVLAGARRGAANAAGKAKRANERERELQGWEKALVFTDHGLRPTHANLITLLTSHPAWVDVIAWDVRCGAPMWNQPPPFRAAASEDREEDLTFAPRTVTDDDIVRMIDWFELCSYHVSFGVGRMREVVNIVAQRKHINTLRDWLRGLPWDGVPRVHDLCWRYFRAKETDPEYLRLVSRYWMVSAVARAIDPGCKVDHVLLLEGDQGLGKSAGLEALFPKGTFSRQPINLENNTNTALGLNGIWGYELDELDFFHRMSIQKIRAFITSPSNDFQPKHLNTTVRRPRCTVFSATFNPPADGAYLYDEAGNRRFWPVTVIEHIDVGAILNDSNQLWAEAVSIYDSMAECILEGDRAAAIMGDSFLRSEYCSRHTRCARHRWWPDSRETQLYFKKPQSDRAGTDAWGEIIATYIAGLTNKDGLGTNDIATYALSLMPKDIDRGTQKRIAAILKDLGYEKRMTGKYRVNRWFLTHKPAPNAPKPPPMGQVPLDIGDAAPPPPPSAQWTPEPEPES